MVDEKPMGTKAKFSKRQLLASKRFQNRRDVLEAVLRGDRLYTLEEAETAVNDFLGRKV